MSTAGAGRSPQLGRIARLVYAEAADLDGLGDVPDADLRILHDQIAHLYFAAGRDNFARVAGLSKVLPGAVAGKLAQHFLPPHLAAQVAVLLEPAKARELVNKVPVPYLAQLSLSLDPTRSKPIVQAIPPARIGEVAAELFRRHEYAAMAEFAGTVTLDALRAALAVASGRDLLAVVPLLVCSDNVTAVLAELPAAQLDQIFAAVVEDRLWDQGTALLEKLPDAARATTTARLRDVDQGTLDALQHAADEGELGDVGATMLADAQRARATRA